MRATACRAAIAALTSALLAGCASSLPTPGELPDRKEEQARVAQKFVEETPNAVEVIKVPRSSMKAVSVGGPLPQHIASMPIDIKFPGEHEATLSSLVQTLSAVNLQVAFQWSNPTQGEDILKRRLPFLGFKGTVGELASTLRTGLGIVTWYEDGLIYISNKERYAITLPQNKEVLDTVKDEIKNLGADNIVTSLRGGKIIYTASPTVQDQVIGPFLDRMSRNLAVVNLQVAVVSLALNDNSDSGFDWNKFQVAFSSTQEGIGEMTNGGAVSSDDASAGKLIGEAVNLGMGGVSFGKTQLGNVFGTYGALTVTSAINFLSNFGSTNVTQNVALKTLSGSTVKLQSGQEVPYVKGVSNTSSGENTIGSTDTETVDTGLKIQMTPQYDSDAKVVTVDVDVELNSILDFVELSAGNQIGSITQPLVQKQNMNDIVRVQAGRTVVIGGLQYDSDTRSGAEPAFIRKALQKQGKGLTGGSRSQQVTRNALFIILRPTLTVYETER